MHCTSLIESSPHLPLLSDDYLTATRKVHARKTGPWKFRAPCCERLEEARRGLPC